MFKLIRKAIAFVFTLNRSPAIYPARALRDSNATYLKRYMEQAYQSHTEQLIFGLTDGDIDFYRNIGHTGDAKREKHIEITQHEYDLINHNIKTLQEKYPYETARLQKFALLEESIKQYFTWQSNFESEFNSFLQSELEETTESGGATQDSDVMSPDIKKKLKNIQAKLRYHNTLLIIKSQLSSISFGKYTYSPLSLSNYSYNR